MVAGVAIAALGVGTSANDTAPQTLRAYLRERRMLLVLDNCEHLLGAVSDLIESVLGAASKCRVLATSREPIGLGGEVVWSLGPLALDIVDRAGTGLGQPGVRSAAEELFRARMKAADPTMTMTDESSGWIRGICVALDGLPLALEFAAGRIRSASLPEILAEVRADPARLMRLGANRHDHHQDLLTIIERSYQRLAPNEQTLHRHLSVLPDPFTRATAAIAVGARLSAADVARGLAMLVHRSMLVRLPSSQPGAPTLFRQLTPIRAHARERLASVRDTEPTACSRDDRVRAAVYGEEGGGHLRHGHRRAGRHPGQVAPIRSAGSARGIVSESLTTRTARRRYRAPRLTERTVIAI